MPYHQQRLLPWWGWITLLLIGIEVVSFSGWVYPSINIIAFSVLCAAVLIISFKKLEWGVSALFTELIIGSKGYLFSVEILGVNVSIRLALFIIVCGMSIVWMIRERHIAILHWKFVKPYISLLGMVVLGVVIGSTSHELRTLFLDANGYLYLAAALPLVQSIRTEQQRSTVIHMLLIAVVLLTIKTFVIVLLFAHDVAFLYSLPGIYQWVRDTGVGEITRFPNGFVRVFFQSHLYAIGAFFVLWIHALSQSQQGSVRRAIQSAPWLTLGVMATLAVVILSYSRSFWMSGAATGVVVGMWAVYHYRSIAALAKICAHFFIIAAGAALIITILIRLPLPGQKDISLVTLIGDRTSNITSEPAASSRWQLLHPLGEQIRQHPILGSGYGATLTYISDDPRVRKEHPDGRYTTYAFEWGYLDFVFKVGIVGTLLYGIFLFSIGRAIVQREWSTTNKTDSIPVYSALFTFLLVTHFFTPYLNHPLGIGLLLLIALGVTPMQKMHVTNDGHI